MVSRAKQTGKDSRKRMRELPAFNRVTSGLGTKAHLYLKLTADQANSCAAWKCGDSRFTPRWPRQGTRLIGLMVGRSRGAVRRFWCEGPKGSVINHGCFFQPGVKLYRASTSSITKTIIAHASPYRPSLALSAKLSDFASQLAPC